MLISHLHFCIPHRCDICARSNITIPLSCNDLSQSDSSSYSVHWGFAEEASKQTGGVLQVVQTTDAEVERPTVPTVKSQKLSLLDSDS